MNSEKDFTPIEIYSGNGWEVELLKSMLESAGITCFLQNEYSGTITPHYTAGGVNPIKLIISSADINEAQPIVEEFHKNQNKDNPIKKNYSLTTLKARPNLNGELLFDDYKISLRNDPRVIGVNIITFGIIGLLNTASLLNNNNFDSLFDRYILPLSCTFCGFFFFYSISKYRNAKKIHEKEFLPADTKEVFIAKSERNIKFRFVLHDGFEPYFKFKNNKKSEKLISFLKESGVEITYA